MNIKINSTFERSWYDYILCTCWLENMKSKVVSLSKKKMLKYFSEIEQLNEFHTLLLDNILSIIGFVYYIEDKTFEISLFRGDRITVNIPQKDFDDMVTNCSADI